MTKIKILPEILSNRIAAGEVVERPASVVKELVENALDAGSSKVIVEIDQGGRSLIRVSDNGNGMGHDDALLSLERYGTSKLYGDAELFQIKTLGFRGEALPSIASVSRFTLVTREKNSPSGTEIDVQGGRIRHVSEIGAPSGTMVSVKQLFYNTPARRKFLKTINTEMSHIADTVSRIALSWPKVRFRLLHNGKIIKNWSAVSDPAERVGDVLGNDLSAALHRMVFSSEAVSITGWIASPRITRSTGRGIYVFVNGRYVHDRMIQHALFEGYRGRLMKGGYPVAVVFVTVPFDRVDVNVHPTKHEVRFLEHEPVHRALINLVSETLHQTDRIASAPASPMTGSEKVGISEPVTPFRPEDDRISFRKEPKEKSGEKPIEGERIPTTLELDGLSTTLEQEGLWEKGLFADLHIIGQLQHTYILCEANEGLVLIDQHAAHERVLLEQLQDRASKTLGSSQALLLPETMEVGYREADVLNTLIPELHRFGLNIEPFGGNTFVAKAVPAFLVDREVKPLVLEIVEEAVAVGTGSPSGLEKALDRCLNLIACHGAIRAHQALNDRQMADLLAQLDKCRNPSQCPHGRPTWIRWSTQFLEKSFRRIV